MIGSTSLIIRGIVGIVAGILAFLWRGITVAVLVVIFALYAFIDGITNLVLGVTRSSARDRGRIVGSELRWLQAVPHAASISCAI